MFSLLLSTRKQNPSGSLILFSEIDPPPASSPADAGATEMLGTAARFLCINY